MPRFALVVALLAALAACSSTPPPPAPTPTQSSAQTSEQQVYLSIGDSYATGFAPGGTGESFAQIVAKQSGLKLVNLACNGATSIDLASKPACGPDAGGKTQLDAAVDVVKGGKVGLVTVVIGGNDLAPCALSQEPLACATRTVADIQTNVAGTLSELREAAPDVKIVGLTYPDVFLGAWVNPSFPNGKNLAQLSVAMFQDFNTKIAAQYGRFGAKFADVTSATGGYGVLTELTQDPKYGQIPASVAKVCALTYFCDRTDVHPTPAGHQAIAEAVTAASR
ncbi:GDSL-type esterase/lipase family protein [Lentzea sp. BCCO 10_0856]|uniref:GDSL-type esterase/lipase family protein n=1 Tax=Lentzea miocenica TaxID=3095431 RepID=A0ABU4SST8_9PSEU|nr:GDSL-type esterase/lipase family protein [Lentzea sp. BCCO 10_0856]MDX8028966.1 GDSL-type esterase/lipase family protein [Lentzea sp. BCCO 10_0856]